MKSQVLQTLWCYVISGEAAGYIWTWSLLGVKGLKMSAGNQASTEVVKAEEVWIYDF